MKSEKSIIQEINNIKEIQKDILDILDALIARLNEQESTILSIKNEINRLDRNIDNIYYPPSEDTP